MDYGYGYSASSSTVDDAAIAGFLAFMGIYLLIALVMAVLSIIGTWKVFEKAGKPGWASIVPIYNIIVMLEIVGKPIWWIALMFVPLANVIVMILMLAELAKVFNKGGGMIALLILLTPVGLMMLGFGDAQYVGAGGQYGQAPQPGAAPAYMPPTQQPTAPAQDNNQTPPPANV